MRVFILMTALLISQNIYAAELSKAKSFLFDKKACKVAIASVMNGNTVPDEVYCVFDGVGNKGTINEFTGCFLGRYNLATDTYRPILNAGAGMMARSQPNGACTQQLVLDILTKYSTSEWHQFASSKMPFLKELSAQDKTVTVIYDEWSILTAEILKSVEARKRYLRPKLKDLKSINCNSEILTNPNDGIYCSSPQELLAQCKNMNMSEQEKNLRKAVYRQKTGQALEKCEMD